MGAWWRESTDTRLLDGLTLVVSRAAAAILAMPRTSLNPREKPDRSPVTSADKASEAVILEGLARLMPGVAVLSEEATGTRPVMPSGGRLSSSIRSMAPANSSPASTSTWSTSP